MFEVVFDLETKNLFSDIESGIPEDLGVSVVSLYEREIKDGVEISGSLQSFWEKDFDRMWKIFENADRIIGFNSIRFDVPALKHYTPIQFHKLKHFDILDKVKDVLGFRLSLNSLAAETLGHGKTDVGTNAVYYWRQGDPESLTKLRTYCEADVIVTKELYDYGYKNKQLKYVDKWNNSKFFPVDFSYPPAANIPQNQISLF
jgi:DEAD/DEAH box helicase domain-containing protein